MALKGTLKDFGIADILQLIGQQQKTGTLHLKARDQEVMVGFVDGNIVKAESSTRKGRDLIGNMLVRAEIITAAQLEEALETQKRTLKRLGDILVVSGRLTRDRFAQMVQLQTTETLYKLFGWKSGTYRFEQGQVEHDGGVKMRAESVLMEGFRMVDEWPVIKKAITSYELSFQRLEELPPVARDEGGGGDVDDAFDDAFGEPKAEKKHSEFKTVGDNERRVYGLAEPGRDVRKLIDVSCIGEFETCKALLNLVNLGYLRPIVPSRKGHALGDAEVGALSRLARTAGPIASSAVAIGLLAVVATRVDLRSFDLTSSPSTFADAAAQRVISRTQIARIGAALEVYQLEKGELPEQLDALVEAGIIGATDIRHPWREPYYYRRTPEGGFVLLPPLR